MFRRVAAANKAVAVAPTSAAMTSLAAQREFTTSSLICSALGCYATMLCFGSWANNFANVRKYGRWRFRNTIDDNILPTDFKTHRYLGCLFGFFFYCTLVGPRKYYRKNTNLEAHPGWVRYGPL